MQKKPSQIIRLCPVTDRQVVQRADGAVRFAEPRNHREKRWTPAPPIPAIIKTPVGLAPMAPQMELQL